MRLAGKVALITGAGAGMGREAALLFAAEGASVVVADLHDDAAQETARAIRAAGGEALAVRCDVAVPEDNRAMVDAAVARYGRLQVFYANAGIVDRRPDGGDVGLERISLETWQRILAVNLTGVFLGCRYAIPEIAKAGGGAVIITASVGALVAHRAHNHAYVASKAALLGLARNLAVEYAPQRVRVNCLCPGQIRTAMMEPFYRDPARAQRVIDLTPMARFGEAREVAQVALFLASDESSFMTGAAVVVDGGWTAV
ncbi:MAG: glucose 1-dehydrogenase [Armatimonadota bacterium]|nr:glucose 1-dehydrogenase [Armatimonadota bacterium]MDR7532659.1 glucose 1-dehydrogenase [Armatimonadota bacterium]MDR7536310.1 glucose 1-dehydrogenase [Armatimonadota bacterium]